MSQENNLESYAEVADSLRERRKEDQRLLYEQLVLEGLEFAAKFRYQGQAEVERLKAHPLGHDDMGRY